MCDTYEYTSLVKDDVAFLCDLLTDAKSPRDKTWTPQDTAEDEVEKLKARVQRYPVGGFIDAGISLAINDLLNGLQGDLDLDGARALLQDISFLVVPSIPQAESAVTTAADRNASRHVLHLPVLLVIHQTHECGLDDSTRNKQRLNCVSAAKFLATLGIKDFPVYGLATSGQYGYCIYITDCNTTQHRFDACEDGMVRFVHFLWGLRQHAEELKARFDSIREELVERMCTEEGRASLRWTLRWQRK
ncbi:hypothetical protein C8T65DRAFT_814840 [Cerioporus squamosus]|nr:hypothetical protein C8T65DRAFT_814840 [Cerioporus squamosus]